MRARRRADRRDRARMTLWLASAADLTAGYARNTFSPRDALECFFTSPLDVLAIGPYVVEKALQ